ncbi:flagellar hook-length control protein FliK [Shewanella litoralis]|uniref:Flagellar hook-length control protein FliK n=1 Tax=Shewanella litoralis TaxID=2282700 RepID=A0ABQ2RAX9_9GAMM|nr:flagellar hook-length control protein FliK [Shewanella litoralis]GGQ21854.1 hypothetical protein GCM10009411_22430 [Shewanella litoralis]
MVLPTTNTATAVIAPAPPKPASASQTNTPENQQAQNTSASTKNLEPNIKSDLSALLLPVQIQQKQTTTNSSTQVTLNIQDQQYQLNKTAELQKLLQQTSQVVIASDQAKLVAKLAASQITTPAELAQQNTPQQTTQQQATQQIASSNKPISTQIILLAQTVQFALPQPLTELAKQNGVSTQQLVSLASRAQGYPLPTALIAQGQLTFTDGPSLKLPNNIVLNDGQYLAKVVFNQQQLQLALTPVIGEVKVDLLKQAPILTSLQQDNIVITKNEPAQILSQFLKKLEATPLVSANANQTNINKTDSNAVSPASPANTLTQHLKTGDNIQQGQIASSTKVDTLTVKADTTNSHLQQSPATLTSSQDKNSIAQGSNQLTNNNNDADNKAVSTQTNEAKSSINKTSAQAALQPTLSANALTGSKQTNEVSAQNQQPAVNKDPQPIEVLNKALSKAGAMPIKQQQTLQIPNSLATELLKHLPQMSPHPLSVLSDPNVLGHELHSLAGLNLAQTSSQANSAIASTLYSGGAITTLFQLLLGVKAKTTGSGISAKLQEHLNQLQQRTLAKLTGNSGLLGALDKLGGADSMAQLAGSIAMYQQASADPNQALTWYFALPYSINQRDEQFEGKFEQENEQDKDKMKGWKLQLKFNLAQGTLLICAHKQGETLDIQFKGNNQALLARVDNFNGALAEKISQIGLTPGTFSTQLTQIPATLLPGDHFLVKTRA